MVGVSGHLHIRWIQGLPRKNIDFVCDKIVCYTSGSHVCFLDLDTKTQSVFESPGRGVGALTANGSSGIFAFSEQKLSPSVFVYIYPELQLKNKLKGVAQLDYTSLTLSDGGPYLAGYSSLPDHAITVWNWESAEVLCSHSQAGRDVISLVFNPLNWLQLCALGASSLTVWNIERSESIHILTQSVIELPATDGSLEQRLWPTTRTVNSDFTYFGPEMPPSAIVGAREEKAERIVTELCTKASLTPAAICWTTTSELYVGCEEGFLLLVDPESRSVSVLFNPTADDALPELKQNNFQALALHRNHLIVIGKEAVVHSLQIKEAQISITQSWTLEGPVTAVISSPDDETLLLYSNMGQIYMLNPSYSECFVKILDIFSGNFAAAAWLQWNKNICVSVRESGELLLRSADGVHFSSLSLQTEVTSLTCCPIAQYAAAGTASGNVLFIDMNKKEQPRLVHQVHLYHTPVVHLVFDPEGHYLLTAASDTHIYVLDAKPSKGFSVIGFTVVPGPVVSLSSQSIRESEEVKILALCSSEKDDTLDGRLLTLLTLPAKDLTGVDCADQYGCLSGHILSVSKYEVPHPVKTCVLGLKEVFAYCHSRKSLQRFQLPQHDSPSEDTNSPSSPQVVQLKPAQEVEGDPLGSTSLVLSPHQLWMASVGQYGQLTIRQTASMEKVKTKKCHSNHLGGARSVAFSADSKVLVTTGVRDGSVVCTSLRVKGVDAAEANRASQWIRSRDCLLSNVFSTENPVLISLPERLPADIEKTEESESSSGRESVDVTEQDEGCDSLLPAAHPSNPTWLESRQEAILKKADLQYDETKNQLKERVKVIRDTIQLMIRENETVPENERLELKEFNLDMEEQMRLDSMVQQEVSRVRNESEQRNQEKLNLCEVLKREHWDSMKVKGKAVKAFYSDREVRNYPMRERTEKELEDLQRVENIRVLEKAVCAQRQLEKSIANEPEQEAKDHEAEDKVTGSFSAELGCSHPHLYDQVSLQTIEQMINQIILLKDVTHKLKTTFNAEFDVVHRQKLQEINRLRDRNTQIRDIMSELGIKGDLWEPDVTASEKPEKLFTVDDSEIKVEKYLSPEKRKEEERKKLEEERHLAAKRDNIRDKALDDMMDGSLEMKKDGFLLKEVPPPEFSLTKPHADWSEEERKEYKEYEKKAEELSAEKEKYRKSLEVEMKKLQAATKDATERFDETFKRLFENKIKYEMAVQQEELKITHLTYSVRMDEVMGNRHVALRLKLEKLLAYKDEIEEVVKKREPELEVYHETYEELVAEDKVLEKDFKKNFANAPKHIVDQLYKLFKRRPRLQRMRAQTDSNSFRGTEPCASITPNGLDKMMTAMEELDAPENMPDVLNLSMWEKLCAARRNKVESEQKVRATALTLAEMQAFLQNRKDEAKAAQEEIKNIRDELESLHKEKNQVLMDTMVQLPLKQGQVEVSPTGLAADYSDSILLHRTIVEDLNRIIQTIGEQKIACMVRTKDIRKDIIQLEWENNVRTMKINNLKSDVRTIQGLRLTEEQKQYVNRTDRGSRVSQMLQEKAQLKDLQLRKQKIEQLNKRAAVIAEKNSELEEQIQDMQVMVGDMSRIYEATGSGQNELAQREERYQAVVRRRKLKDTVQAQAEELAQLNAELQRLMMRNFPSLEMMKH